MLILFVKNNPFLNWLGIPGKIQFIYLIGPPIPGGEFLILVFRDHLTVFHYLPYTSFLQLSNNVPNNVSLLPNKKL